MSRPIPNRRVYPTAKPYPTYPLTPRKDGRFSKKIHGVPQTFGRAGDWKKALDEYMAAANALHHRQPRPVGAPELATVRQIANRYLRDRELDVKAGSLTLGAWGKYQQALKEFRKFVGPETPVKTLSPATFADFGQSLRKRLGSYAFNRTRALIRSWLRHAAASEWIEPVNIGMGFNRVSAGKIRSERKRRLFTVDEVAKLRVAAGPQIGTMILLGLNGGFGATDCANLTRAAVDLSAGLISYRRRKTNVDRLVTMWPETVKSLAALMVIRPDDPYIFRTRHGQLWVRETRNGTKVITKDSVSMQFGKLMKASGITMPGVGFYALRHTFRTYADEAKDPHAAMRIMGHSFPGMSDAYIEAVSVERLKAVTDHVRSRLIQAE